MLEVGTAWDRQAHKARIEHRLDMDLCFYGWAGPEYASSFFFFFSSLTEAMKTPTILKASCGNHAVCILMDWVGLRISLFYFTFFTELILIKNFQSPAPHLQHPSKCAFAPPQNHLTISPNNFPKLMNACIPYDLFFNITNTLLYLLTLTKTVLLVLVH